MKAAPILVLAAVIGSAMSSHSRASAQKLGYRSVTTQIKGLPRACSVTAWGYFTLPPGGHQPWRFTMYYGAGTSCAGGGGLKFLTVWVERWTGGHWLVVDRPSTNRIAQPTRNNPRRISAHWTALPSTPRGTTTSPAKYRVVATATISFQKHPQIPPVFVRGLVGYGTAHTPATAP